jgi:hypothetical protein
MRREQAAFLSKPREPAASGLRLVPGDEFDDGAQIVPATRALFVPEQGMAAHCQVGMSRDDALDAIGRKEHEEATAATRARATEYVSSLPRIDARCRELQATFAIHPDAIREQLRTRGLSLDDLALPTFNLTRAQRDALLHW